MGGIGFVGQNGYLYFHISHVMNAWNTLAFLSCTINEILKNFLREVKLPYPIPEVHLMEVSFLALNQYSILLRDRVFIRKHPPFYFFD